MSSFVVLLTSLLSLYTIPAIYKYYKTGRNIDEKKSRFFYIAIVLFFILAFAGPLFPDGPDEQGNLPEGRGTSTAVLFIAIPMFYAMMFRKQFRAALSPLMGIPLAMYVITFFLLWPLDISVGYDNADNLIAHQITLLGFYLGLAPTLIFLFKRFAFTPAAVFTIGGILGVTIEQQFLGIILLFGNPIGFVMFAPMIFLTYGMYLLGPYLLFYDDFNKLKLKTHKWNNILLFVCVAIIPLAVWLSFGTVLGGLFG